MVLRDKRYKHKKKTVLGTLNNALRGISYTFNEEINFRIHTIAAVIVLLFAYILELSMIEVIICILLIGLVLGFELINTVVEMIVDLVKPEYNELAGMIKDAASGAVLIMAITSAIIGVLIFLPKVLIFIGL